METQKQDEIQEADYPERRRPWTAVFLSLLMPGMGQIYCGSIVEGLILMLIVSIFSTTWMFIMIIDRVRENTPVGVSYTAWVFVLLTTVIAVIDAYRRARRTRYDYTLKDYNRWDVYLVLFWMCGAGTFGFTAIVRMNLFEAFYVPANSMAPSIMAGDRLLANRTAYHLNDPDYGDVVLFKNPEKRTMNYIKRVVALAGDTIEVKDGQLLINGTILERELVGAQTLRMDNERVEGKVYWENNGDAKYQIFISENEIENHTQLQDFGPVTLPQHHCFVMGDNRNHCVDSRQFGPLSYGELEGRFTQMYWPLKKYGPLDSE